MTLMIGATCQTARFRLRPGHEAIEGAASAGTLLAGGAEERSGRYFAWRGKDD
jgi:hypothetical protein